MALTAKCILKKLLEYEVTIFTDLQANDGLVIAAKGLGINRILLSFLQMYCEATFLVLVLNTNTEEEEFLIDELRGLGISQLPKVITNEFGTNERESIYLKGGVLFITSRILVVDILTNRLPTHLVTGIIVYKAHRIVDSGQEAFILRMYREKNKTGFIKAFSDSPMSFTSGFFHVERVMRNLFVRKLFLWPRFQASVSDVLEKNKPDVIEIHVELTPLMTSVQMAILDLLGCCLRELKRSHQSLDAEEVTVENCIAKSFDKYLRSQLDPVWFQLSSKTRQLVSDLKVLRTLMLANEKNATNPSLWLFMDAANTLFVNARARIYGSARSKSNNKNGGKRTNEPISENIEDELIDFLEIEESPKWKALSEVLEEIKTDSQKAEVDGRTLIAASDERTCSQLREYLCGGGKTLLQRLHVKTFGKKDASKGISKKGKYEKRPRKKVIDDSEDEFQIELLPDAFTIIHPLKGNSDPHSLLRTLTEFQPRFIVLYDADMEFVRQIEASVMSSSLSKHHSESQRNPPLSIVLPRKR
eukprot:gene7975-8834_t